MSNLAKKPRKPRGFFHQYKIITKFDATTLHLKLINFATASVRGLAEINSPVHEDAPVGSVNYIASETDVDGTAIMQSDLFTLAVIIYEMLAQKLPYQMEKVQRSGAKSVSEWKWPATTYKPA